MWAVVLRFGGWVEGAGGGGGGGGGGGVVGREPNLKSDPLIFVVCLRGSSAGQVGARALRQEQRGGCMGGWATGGW